MRESIPFTVIGGYLGAGKTTLQNHILHESAGRRFVLLVNHFGSVSIDAALVASRTGARSIWQMAVSAAHWQKGSSVRLTVSLPDILHRSVSSWKPVAWLNRARLRSTASCRGCGWTG